MVRLRFDEDGAQQFAAQPRVGQIEIADRGIVIHRHRDGKIDRGTVGRAGRAAGRGPIGFLAPVPAGGIRRSVPEDHKSGLQLCSLTF